MVYSCRDVLEHLVYSKLVKVGGRICCSYMSCEANRIQVNIELRACILMGGICTEEFREMKKFQV